MSATKVTTVRPNPHAGDRDPWGGIEPPTLRDVLWSGDSDGDLSAVVGQVQALMSERGYTRFTVEEVPDAQFGID